MGQGDAISPYYDSMIAKLIVWGEDRAQALARLDAALGETHIVGLHTNVAFLRRVVRSHAFATADLDTALIERERDALFGAPPLSLAWCAAGVLAHRLAEEAALEGADPWSRRDGWRLHGGARRRLEVVHAGARHTLWVVRQHDGGTVVEVEGRPMPFTARAQGSDRHDVTLDGERRTLAVYRQGERHTVFAPEGSALVEVVDALAHAGDTAAEGGGLAAPMPGKVVSVLARAGDRVTRGQALAVMEAMKMEHTLSAPHDGVVREVLYAPGDQVSEGAELMRLEAAA